MKDKEDTEYGNIKMVKRVKTGPFVNHFHPDAVQRFGEFLSVFKGKCV